MNYKIGDLAEKYEVGNRGPGYISNGDKWDPGGDSYGSYQLATKVGTLQGYLATSLPYVDRLKKHKIKSTSFDFVWKDIAAKDPEGFKQSQFDYVAGISYIPCRKYADSIGIANSFAINSALFSISNQHGKWKRVLNNAKISQTDNEATQVEKLYDSRKEYVKGLTTLSSTVKKNVIKQRCELEKADCLSLINNSHVDVKPVTQQKRNVSLKETWETIKNVFTSWRERQ